ncbi:MULTISPECIES: hypothetical protein [unclassified Arthrobacter]|uniref:hypothetical protein n=1 Tax=unclassified Arthrobacter TaxID=235627 RepID=UPI0027D8E8C6|nr:MULTISPECIES: hypothetical protein [unclassified Arthrobacter]
MSGHVLDADVGHIALRLRYGFKDEQSLEASTREDRIFGPRKWISVNGIEAPLLDDDASSILGYAEFSDLESVTSRELVNEAVQALSSIWEAATARVESDRSGHVPIAKSLKQLNRIAREVDPIEAWEPLMKDLLIRGRETHGSVSGLRFDAAPGLALPNHFHKVNVFLRFTPVGGQNPTELAVIWHDRGEGTAALDVRFSDIPGSETGAGSRKAGGVYVVAQIMEAIQVATEWLAALEHGGHEFVFAETFPVVQRMEEARRAGLSSVDDEVLRCRAEAVRRSAVAHLNQWAREVFP